MDNERNERKQNEKKKVCKSSVKVRILLTIFVLALLLIGGLTARYISSNKRKAEMTSSQFHVTSDYLEEGGANYNITNWGDGFHIQLYNYEKENLALVLADRISYQVEISDPGKWECTADTGNGVLEGNGVRTSNTLTVTPKTGVSINQNDTVTVTVKTTEPYVKELKATFTVTSKRLPENELTQSNSDGNQWHLVIKTNDYAGTVTVTWPNENICPDTTNEYMSNWSNNGSNNLTVQENTTYDLVFLRNNESDSFMLSPGSESGASIVINKQ